MKLCFPNWPWDGSEEVNDEDIDAPRPGTKKMVRKHPKVVSVSTK